MPNTIKFPFYIRLSFTMISLIAIIYIINIGSNVFVPLLFGFVFAVLVLPIVNFLNYKLHFPNILSSSIAVIIYVAIILGIFAFLSFQINDIANDFVEIKKTITALADQIQKHIRNSFHISLWEQRKYIDDVTQDSVKNGTYSIGSALLSITDTILNITLIPIYTFLMLLYKNHFILFLTKLFRKGYHEKLQEILYQIKTTIQSYIIGLIIEMIVVSVLSSIGLYFIGLKYIILLGIITGILNLIPYLGILVAGILTIISSLSSTSEISLVLGVIIVNIIVQVIDNNILVPMIINKKVQINAFVSIIGIIIGGQIAGIAGMFLAIPILAILKIIFDRIESVEAWGYLMGDNLPKSYIWRTKKPNL